jgi:allophanate hydrolase
MAGLPLNGQLLDAGGRFWRHARSAPGYRFYRLPGEGVARPALVRDPDGDGRIALEIWCVDRGRFGDFVAGVRPPLAIGPVDLDDGARVPGFVGDASAAEGATEITRFGTWRDYLAAERGA